MLGTLLHAHLLPFEAIASLWNSEEFNPKTDVSSCHEEFAESIDCGYEAFGEMHVKRRATVNSFDNNPH